MGDKALLRSRSWRWLRVRILGLLATDCRLSRRFTPDESHSEGGDVS